MQKKSIFFLLPAFIAANTILAQVNFASFKSDINNQDKKIASSLLNYSALTRPVAHQQFLSFSGSSFTSTAVKDNTREENSYSGERSIKTNAAAIPAAVENKTIISENIEISFKPIPFNYPENSRVDIGITHYSASQLILYAQVLKQYAKKNGFDTSYAFLANMGMLSNRKRFFVVNLATMEIEQAGLVAHGRGQGPSIYDKQYSNQSGSRCTSLGRYKISGKYRGGYGESYRMAGLDSSNKNAYSRNIVLHSMTCIPDLDGIMPACVSDGCPAVSTNFLTSLRKIIDTRKKPVLLWVFDSNMEEAIAQRIITKEEEEEAAWNKYHSCAMHPHPRAKQQTTTELP